MKTIPPITDLNHLVQKQNYKTEGNWMVRTFLREWALPCTWVCLKLGISANQVTCFSILIAFLGAFLISFENSTAFLWGMILIQFWYYLDHVDGQIARFHEAASLTGRFFDFVMHHVVHGVVYFGAGLYLFQVSGNSALIYLAGLSSLSIMTFNLLHDAKYKTFFEHIQKNQAKNWRMARPKLPSESSSSLGPGFSYSRRVFSLLHKLNEIHVAMNILTVVAMLSFFGFFFFRNAAAWFYALTPSVLVSVKLFYIIGRKQIDADFSTIFTESEEAKCE